MTFLDHALSLASKGFHVFPLQANSKLPAVKDFPNVATTDEKTIREWWNKRPYCNVGISTTLYNGGKSALLVVDVDNKGDKKGTDEIIRLELQGKDFPATLTQRTPSGGQHFIYKTQVAVKQSSNRLAPGLDTRSHGGYIVASGSSIDGKLYSFETGCADISDVPQWLLESFSAPNERTRHVAPNVDARIDVSRAKKRAQEYLESAPLAFEGQGGDQTTFSVICKLKDFGVTPEDALEILVEQDGWNDRCSPPWQVQDLKSKIQNAFRYGTNAPGAAAPETQFETIVEDAPEMKGEDSDEFYLKKMNKDYAIVYEESGHTILHETVDEKGRPRRMFMPEVSFKRKFSPLTVTNGKGRPKTWAEEWLDWPGRREYAGICFTPEHDPAHNYYNLWRGYSVEPIGPLKSSSEAVKGFEMFISHAKENICDNDKDLFKWLMGYFAHMIQKPYEKPLTSLVFSGEKGTGKNAFLDRIGRLYHRGHYLVAHESRYLTSNFNGHLDSCICLVLDEAFWSGDKSAEGKLKGLITAPEIFIERKGKEPYTVDNLVRLVIVGNDPWLVPASNDERRYAVFSIGKGKQQQTEFFEEMRILMDHKGGAQILLHYLQNYDLSAVNINRAPNTEALNEQKLSTQEPFYEWWHDCLSEGKIVGSDFGNSWPLDIGKESMRQAFGRHCKERNIKNRYPSVIAFGKSLRKCLPSAIYNQKSKEGEEYINVYRLPTLEESRADWDSYMKFKTKWE